MKIRKPLFDFDIELFVKKIFYQLCVVVTLLYGVYLTLGILVRDDIDRYDFMLGIAVITSGMCAGKYLEIKYSKKKKDEDKEGF